MFFNYWLFFNFWLFYFKWLFNLLFLVYCLNWIKFKAKGFLYILIISANWLPFNHSITSLPHVRERVNHFLDMNVSHFSPRFQFNYQIVNQFIATASDLSLQKILENSKCFNFQFRYFFSTWPKKIFFWGVIKSSPKIITSFLTETKIPQKFHSK